MFLCREQVWNRWHLGENLLGKFFWICVPKLECLLFELPLKLMSPLPMSTRNVAFVRKFAKIPCLRGRFPYFTEASLAFKLGFVWSCVPPRFRSSCSCNCFIFPLKSLEESVIQWCSKETLVLFARIWYTVNPCSRLTDLKFITCLTPLFWSRWGGFDSQNEWILVTFFSFCRAVKMFISNTARSWDKIHFKSIDLLPLTFLPFSGRAELSFSSNAVIYWRRTVTACKGHRFFPLNLLRFYRLTHLWLNWKLRSCSW